MDKSRRKELQEQYKEIKTYLGVIRITNQVNGKIYVAGYPNLKNKWLMIQSQLDLGRFHILPLQKEWKEYGAAAFTYDVLEEKAADDISDVSWAVKQLEKVWLEKLQPYGERGYNRLKPNPAD
ncbi:GIY-YIG nuclease family protein [Gorillibacterium sp. sgz5001074]|uniref:GIY-YIG nuclease family protein n=1 Tax=Gorillibacterium sp. sgz5001074 TaxID=3446695 RepID=UPI003F67C453